MTSYFKDAIREAIPSQKCLMNVNRFSAVTEIPAPRGTAHISADTQRSTRTIILKRWLGRGDPKEFGNVAIEIQKGP